jgi:hypothetical protein
LDRAERRLGARLDARLQAGKLIDRRVTAVRSAVVTRRAEPAMARDFAQFGEFRRSDAVLGLAVSSGSVGTERDRVGPVVIRCDRS